MRNFFSFLATPLVITYRYRKNEQVTETVVRVFKYAKTFTDPTNYEIYRKSPGEAHGRNARSSGPASSDSLSKLLFLSNAYSGNLLMLVFYANMGLYK